MRLKSYIDETTKFSNAMRYLYGIKNFGEGLAILTSMNPMAKDVGDNENNKLYKSLMELLKTKGKKYIKQQGIYGGNNEKSVIIIDISLRETQEISKNELWKQESFIWMKRNRDDGMKIGLIGNGRIEKMESVETGKVVDKLSDYYSTVGNRKYRISMNESMASTKAAYFISPYGDIIQTDTSHIATIIKNPSKFGYTKEQIQSIYDKYNEKLNVEGKAREEILKDLMSNGWIRIRRYPNKFWSVQVPVINKKVKDFIFDWAERILKGIQGFREDDKYMPVKITALKGGYDKTFTVDSLSKDIMYNESVDEAKMARMKLVERKVEELPDIENYNPDTKDL